MEALRSRGDPISARQRAPPAAIPLLNPVAIAIALVAAQLGLIGTDYQAYFTGAQLVHFPMSLLASSCNRVVHKSVVITKMPVRRLSSRNCS